jgi:2'-5' RNA ligase
MINEGVMLAFLPTDGSWCKQPLPHMTLVYAGTMDDVSYTAFGDLAKDALSVARLVRRPFSLDVLGIEQFGDEGQKVDVLKLQSTSTVELARRHVQMWNASEKPFTPHATIGPEGSAEGEIPTALYFDRIVAVWGPKTLTFRLGGEPRDY